MTENFNQMKYDLELYSNANMGLKDDATSWSRSLQESSSLRVYDVIWQLAKYGFESSYGCCFLLGNNSIIAT